MNGWRSPYQSTTKAEIPDQSDDLIDGSYAFNELLETQGTRLHFLCLLVAQLEQSAEFFDEANAVVQTPPPPISPPRKRRSRAKKIEQASAEGKTDDA